MKSRILFFFSVGFVFVQQVVAQNRVGIGTNTPSANLHVNNPIKSVLKISSSSFEDSSQLIFSNRIGVNGTDMSIEFNRETGLRFLSKSDLAANTVNNILMLTPNGMVGIRNSAPQYPLDINGNVNLSGNLRVSGSFGNPGNVLAIKPDGTLGWSTVSLTITDTLTIQPYNVVGEFASFPFIINQLTFLGYGSNTSGGVVFYHGPIEIPVSNAVIKEVTAYLYDANASSDIILNVFEAPLTSIAIAQRTTLATLNTTGSNSNMQLLKWTPLSPYPIHNGSKSYFFRIRTLSGAWSGDTSLGFRALRIIYTYTR